MKGTPAPLVAHYALGTTTICSCWKVTRTDATVFGFTSLDRDLVVSSVTYKARTGYAPSSIRGSSDASVPNMEMAGVLDSASITEADIQAGLWDYADVEIFEVNYANISQGISKLQKGTLGALSVSGDGFTAEIRGLIQRLQQTVGELYMPTCRADLGDTRCGVNLATYTVSGTVTSVASQRDFTDTAKVQAAGYFNGGKVTWTSGANTGASMEVKAFSTGVFALFLNMGKPVIVGDAYTVYPGCNKLLKTAVGVYGGDCKVKFNNVLHFRGECELPGMDALLKPAGTV